MFRGCLARHQHAVVLRFLLLHGHGGEQGGGGVAKVVVKAKHALDTRGLVDRRVGMRVGSREIAQQEFVGRRDDKSLFLCQPVPCAPHGVSQPKSLRLSHEGDAAFLGQVVAQLAKAFRFALSRQRFFQGGVLGKVVFDDMLSQPRDD